MDFIKTAGELKVGDLIMRPGMPQVELVVSKKVTNSVRILTQSWHGGLLDRYYEYDDKLFWIRNAATPTTASQLTRGYWFTHYNSDEAWKLLEKVTNNFDGGSLLELRTENTKGRYKSLCLSPSSQVTEFPSDCQLPGSFVKAVNLQVGDYVTHLQDRSTVIEGVIQECTQLERQKISVTLGGTRLAVIPDLCFYRLPKPEPLPAPVTHPKGHRDVEIWF